MFEVWEYDTSTNEYLGTLPEPFSKYDAAERASQHVSAKNGTRARVMELRDGHYERAKRPRGLVYA